MWGIHKVEIEEKNVSFEIGGTPPKMWLSAHRTHKVIVNYFLVIVSSSTNIFLGESQLHCARPRIWCSTYAWLLLVDKYQPASILASPQTHVYTLLIWSKMEAKVHSTNYDFQDNLHSRPRMWMVIKRPIKKYINWLVAPLFYRRKKSAKAQERWLK